MKYAVIYQSKNGNTRRVAKEIYESLCTENKEIFDIDQGLEMPEADVYFIGFGIRNGTCSMDIINCFDQITDGQFALFATCGYVATEQYKANLEKRLDVWMPEKAAYMGMFLCQGNVEEDQRKIMISKMPGEKDRMLRMFEMGSSHPDENDIQNAAEFARNIQRKAERNGKKPIL